MVKCFIVAESQHAHILFPVLLEPWKSIWNLACTKRFLTVHLVIVHLANSVSRDSFKLQVNTHSQTVQCIRCIAGNNVPTKTIPGPHMWGPAHVQCMWGCNFGALPFLMAASRSGVSATFFAALLRTLRRWSSAACAEPCTLMHCICASKRWPEVTQGVPWVLVGTWRWPHRILNAFL